LLTINTINLGEIIRSVLKGTDNPMRHAKFMLVLLGIIVLGVFSTEVRAQGTEIKYGQDVTGELSSSAKSIDYTFKAEANDVVVVRMKQEGSDSSVSPRIILLDSKQQTIADSKDQIAIFSVNLGAQLTEAGQYTITATGADDKSAGKFKLSLAKATVLAPGTPATGKGSSETYIYYSHTSGDPFTIIYEKKAGDFAPTISVNRVDENHELRSVGELSGALVSKGSIGVQPKEKELYIVSIGEGTLDINFQPVTVDYALSLETKQ
jgi:hypothetical protein